MSGSASTGMARRQPGQFRPAAQRGGTTAGPGSGSGALNRGRPGPGCLGDVDGRPLFSDLGIGVAGLAVGITRSSAGPSWVQITILAMALPESVRQDLLAKLRKALLHLAVVVARLELVVEVFDHVGAVAGEVVNQAIFIMHARAYLQAIGIDNCP